jgi:2-polyprenyl-3-methyl-5-hydroxy-6-metoxy-1,4-benzoquinol methylase
VRAIADPWLLRSRYWNRSSVKPHGYAGDFRMLEWMYDLEHDRCADVTQPAVVNVLDALYAGVHSVQAVWHRRRWFADLVRRERQRRAGHVRVLDVACGGSRYLRDVMAGRNGAAGMQVVFVDQDPAAISFVESWCPSPGCVTECAPARDLRDAVAIHRHEGFDVVLATGLFDYLPRADAEALLGDMTTLTRPRGVTAICNFSPDDGSRLVKDWISEWALTYRTEDELAALFPRPAAVELDRSPDGGLIYASARRTS